MRRCQIAVNRILHRDVYTFEDTSISRSHWRRCGARVTMTLVLLSARLAPGSL